MAVGVDGFATSPVGRDFVLPIGTASQYRSFVVRSTTGSVTAGYVLGQPANPSALGPGVSAISSLEFWRTPAASGNGKISVTWNAGSGVQSLTNSSLGYLTLLGWNVATARWELITSRVETSGLVGGSSTPSFLGNAPSFASGTISSASTVNLSTYSAYTLGRVDNHEFWDGAAQFPNSTVDGGNGTWDATTTNWTTSDGTSNAAWRGDTQIPVFTGQAGVVTVQGTQSVGGLIFRQVFGLTGGKIIGAAPNNRVDVTAPYVRIVSVLGGTSWEKTGPGELQLGGVSDFTGPTLLSAGSVKLYVSNALPQSTSLTVSAGAVFDVSSYRQQVAALNGEGEVRFNNGELTLTSNSTFSGTFSGTGKIIVKAGTTLTLQKAFSAPGVTIVLDGGQLVLGAPGDFSIAALTVNSSSTLQFAESSLTNLRVSTFSPGAPLRVRAWSPGLTSLIASSVTPTVAYDTLNQPPLNQVTFDGFQSSVTTWMSGSQAVAPALVRIKIATISYGGIGRFTYQLSSSERPFIELTTAVSGAPAESATLLTAFGDKFVITQTSAPDGWPLPQAGFCTDANGSQNTNGSSRIGTLDKSALTIPATAMVPGAIFTCTFANPRGSFVQGVVFNDGGSPVARVNTGIPNNGIKDGSEAGIAGRLVSLTDCNSAVHASAKTDGSGAFVLNLPSRLIGANVCLGVQSVPAELATGASVSANTLPPGQSVTVRGMTYTYAQPEHRIEFRVPISGVIEAAFGSVPASNVSGDVAATVPTGSFVHHPFRFYSGTAGSLRLRVIADVANAALTSTAAVYEDPQCTGAYQSNLMRLDPQIPKTVLQGDQLCFVLRQFVPANLATGSSISTRVQLDQQLANSTAMYTYYAVANTQVTGAALRLQKHVRNITAGGENTAWTTDNQGKSGDVLEYRITVTNMSAEAISDVMLHDATTSWTSWNALGIPALPDGVVCTVQVISSNAAVPESPCTASILPHGKGSVTWKLAGRLLPTASSTVVYRTSID